MEYVNLVYDYFRDLAQEADQTFLTPAQVQAYLKMGYQKFRSHVCNVDPDIFLTTQDITVAGRSYDLLNGTVKLFGSAATTRLWRLHQVQIRSGTLYSSSLYPAHDEAELNDPPIGQAYLLRGTTLYFSADLATTVRLIFVPHEKVDWTKITATPPLEWIDDLVDFHDIIALFGYKHYAVRDWATNPHLEALLQQRLSDLTLYLNQGRSSEQATQVSYYQLETDYRR